MLTAISDLNWASDANSDSRQSDVRYGYRAGTVIAPAA